MYKGNGLVTSTLSVSKGVAVTWGQNVVALIDIRLSLCGSYYVRVLNLSRAPVTVRIRTIPWPSTSTSFDRVHRPGFE